MTDAAESTRERVLESACATFAAVGYRNATVADICDRADANIAAVNYYFGDKLSLYNACWRHAFKLTSARFPLQGAPGAEASDEARLRNFIRAFVLRIFSDDEASYFPRMMVKEMAEPTEALESILDEVVAPQKAMLEGIISALMGPDADSMQIRGCAFSVISQCVFFCFNRAMRDRHFAEIPDTALQVNLLADHIWRFSLAGIRGMG